MDTILFLRVTVVVLVLLVFLFGSAAVSDIGTLPHHLSHQTTAISIHL